MGKAERNSKKLENLRWFWFIPSALMYAATQIPFGKGVALALSAVFGIAFYFICSRGRMLVICEDIVRDVAQTLERLGQNENVFEVKSMSFGIVVRVYMVKARQGGPACTKAILDKLSKGWYKKFIWITQVVDIDGEKDIKEAQKALDQSLLDDINEKKRNK